MRSLTLTQRLPFLTPEAGEQLSQLLSDQGIITARQVKIATGITLAQAAQVLAVLAAEGVGTYGFLVMHTCDNQPMDSAFFGPERGIPTVPYHCDNCDEDVLDKDELAFGIAFDIGEPVKVVMGQK